MVELGLSRVLQSGLGLRRRMAGARGTDLAAARLGNPLGARRRIAARPNSGVQLFRQGLALLAGVLLASAAQAQVVSSRIWPARDYTRPTLEAGAELKVQLFSVKDPERLVLDLETPELTPALAELDGKVTPDDPYIKGLRVARNRPGVI